MKSVGTQAANLDLGLNWLNHKLNKAASYHGAWEPSENVRLVFITISSLLPAPVTACRSCGVQGGLTPWASSPAPCPALYLECHSPGGRCILADIKSTVTCGSQSKSVFLQGLKAPLWILFSYEAFSADHVICIGDISCVSRACGMQVTAGPSA